MKDYYAILSLLLEEGAKFEGVWYDPFSSHSDGEWITRGTYVVNLIRDQLHVLIIIIFFRLEFMISSLKGFQGLKMS